MHALYDALDAAVAARAPQLAAGQATGLPTAMAVQDTLANLVSGLGTDRDKVTHGRFVFEFLDKAELDAMYASDWLAGKLTRAAAKSACTGS